MTLQQLKEKFGDCKYAAVSDCTGSYEHMNEQTFYLYDPPPEENKPTRISTDGAYQLTVENPDQRDICLVKTDKCLFTDAVSKCDCILFSTSKLYFVEIKDSKTSQRHAGRKKAVEQLSATIEHFNDNGINLSTYATKAIICFKSLSPYPIRASFLSEKAIFNVTYNISLEEGNKIEF